MAARCIRGIWLMVAALVVSVPAAAAEPVRVVASFSILEDMVRVIGGADIELTTLIERGGDAHAYDPTPADIRRLSQAQVLVVNGLGFEGWVPRLVSASGFRGEQIVASDGVKPVALSADAVHHHDHGGHSHHDHKHSPGSGHHHPAPARSSQIDPHAWQDLENGVVYARNIAQGLARVDPANASHYLDRAGQYIAQLQARHADIKAALAAIPVERRRVVTPHAAFGYFGAAYGIEFLSLAGLSSDAEPSARDMARLIQDIRASKSTALFAEGVSANTRVIEQVARETGLRVGGVLFSDSLDAPGRPAATYLGMFSTNAGNIISALSP